MKSNQLLRLVCLVIFPLIVIQVNVVKGSEMVKPSAMLKKAVKNIFKGATIESVTTTPIKGLYQIIVAQGVFYITKDGDHLISGELIKTANKENLTEKTRKLIRKDTLASFDSKDMIIFSPKKVKHSVTVFTDVDCGYCRKLHSEINSYLEKGIEIKYLAFPRAGIMSENYRKTVSIWCSKEKKKTFTNAKLGKKIKPQSCDNPVAKEYNLGLKFGLQGTPAILLNDGTLVPGYLSASDLEKRINSSEAKL